MQRVRYPWPLPGHDLHVPRASFLLYRIIPLAMLRKCRVSSNHACNGVCLLDLNDSAITRVFRSLDDARRSLFDGSGGFIRQLTFSRRQTNRRNNKNTEKNRFLLS